jgi:hypothetical protein
MTTYCTKLTQGRVYIATTPDDCPAEEWLKDIARCIAAGTTDELEILAVLPGDRVREMRDKFGANCCGCCRCDYCLSFNACQCVNFETTDRPEIRAFLAAEAR